MLNCPYRECHWPMCQCSEPEQEVIPAAARPMWSTVEKLLIVLVLAAPIAGVEIYLAIDWPKALPAQACAAVSEER